MTIYKNKTALITGASSGIGEAFARELAAKGSNLILVARSKEKLDRLGEQLSTKYGIHTYVIPSDLSKAGAPQQLAEEVQKLNLSVDILINNAGFGTHGLFEEVSRLRQQEEIMLNVSALVELTHLFMPHMVQQKSGTIVNVASNSAFQPVPYMAVYGATKAFVLSFSEALWAENRNRGINILALCPGSTETAFFDAAGADGMSMGALSTPQKVVQTAFRALERRRSYVIEGKKNYLLAQLARFLPRQRLLRIVEPMFRPSKQD